MTCSSHTASKWRNWDSNPESNMLVTTAQHHLPGPELDGKIGPALSNGVAIVTATAPNALPKNIQP